MCISWVYRIVHASLLVSMEVELKEILKSTSITSLNPFQEGLNAQALGNQQTKNAELPSVDSRDAARECNC